MLIFPDGAKLNNSSINNSFEGNGTFYMDTWKDYNETIAWAAEKSYNLYSTNANSGSMQSVVINTEKAGSKGVNGIRESEFTGSIIWVRLDYENNAESSFYKKANNADFANAATFKTDWVQTEDSGLFGWGSTEFRKSMTFNIGDVWAEGTGINLAFLNK